MKPERETSAEIIKLLSGRYPKFTKIQLCMLRNPEYGLRLSAEGERILKKNNIILTPEKRKGAMRERQQKPTKKRVSLRLSQEEYETLKASVKESGCKTTQEYLERLINKKEGN